MLKKLKVDPAVCIGCGTCSAMAAGSFRMDESGKSVAVNPPGDDEATVQKAIESCPVSAISWEE